MVITDIFESIPAMVLNVLYLLTGVTFSPALVLVDELL
jgi:hypothetical protein